MFDLKQLRCFVAVAEELNFRRAASGMNMTQSPFSRQIRLLEQDLGVQLLDRGNRKVQLTPPGQTLLANARHILQATSTVVAAARQTAAGERGSIALGFTTTAGFSLMPEVVALARADLPNVSLVLRELSSQQQMDELKTGALDFGLVWAGENAALRHIPLMADPLIAALPPHDKRLKKPWLGPRDFHGQDFIMYAHDSAGYLHNIVSGMLDSEGCSPRFVQHLPNAHVMLSMVGSGMGAAIVPQSAAGLHLDGVKFRPLRCAVRCHTEIHGVWRGDNPNPALARFVQIIGSLTGHSRSRTSTPPAIKQCDIDPAVAIARRKVNDVSLVE
jgi:DNA-binding transcriptional LysR family regulator